MPADFRPYRQAVASRSRFGPAVLAVFAVGGLIAAAIVIALLGMVLAAEPVVALGTPFKLVGRTAELVVEARDPKHGIKALRISVEQAGKEHVLLDQKYDPPARGALPVDGLAGQVVQARGRAGPPPRPGAERVVGRVLPRPHGVHRPGFTARLSRRGSTP